MARRRNGRSKPSRQDREQRRVRKEAEELADMVNDTTARFTCSTDVVQDFAEQCDQRIDDLEFDLVCTQLALDIWTPVATETAPHIVELLREVATERERHLRALRELRERFAALAARDIHDHLEPTDHYAEMVFRRLFMDPAEEQELFPMQ